MADATVAFGPGDISWSNGSSFLRCGLTTGIVVRGLSGLRVRDDRVECCVEAGNGIRNRHSSALWGGQIGCLDDAPVPDFWVVWVARRLLAGQTWFSGHPVHHRGACLSSLGDCRAVNGQLVLQGRYIRRCVVAPRGTLGKSRPDGVAWAVAMHAQLSQVPRALHFYPSVTPWNLALASSVTRATHLPSSSSSAVENSPGRLTFAVLPPAPASVAHRRGTK